jgi:hypothetical protein
MCNSAIKQMTAQRLKNPHSFHKDFFWIICSLLLAIRVFCECTLSIQTPTPGLTNEEKELQKKLLDIVHKKSYKSLESFEQKKLAELLEKEEKKRLLCCSRLLCCIPLLMRIGNPSEELMNILIAKIFMLSDAEGAALKKTVLGAYNLLRASRNIKDQFILGAANSFGSFYKVMGDEADCFGKHQDPKKKDVPPNVFLAHRSAFLRMFSPGLNRKIAEGLLDNLTSCSAMSDALLRDATAAIIDCATLGASGPPPRCSFVEATVTHLKDDDELLREAKRQLTADFSGFNFLVKKAIDLKFRVNKQSISSAVLDRVKESLEGCKGDDDEVESEESQGLMSKVVDSFTPEAFKKIVPAVVTVVQICSKDVPAILRKLTNEYFVDREQRFDLLRSEDDCLDKGIPFNPAQLAEPGNYMDITKKISNPLQIKYSTLKHSFHFFVYRVR